ncbi:MAG: histidine phosphatase family protein [Hyphomicrobiales bacterium]
MTPILYFVRHGQTDWNAEARFQGTRDIPLNDIGRGQASHNGKTLKGIVDPSKVKFIASPLMRTRETMEIVRREMGLDAEAYETDDRLKELSFGDWEGRTVSELEETQSQLWAARQENKWSFRPPQGESYQDLADRLRSWVDEIQGPLVVVSHGGVNRGLRFLLSDPDVPSLASAAIPQDKVMIIEDGVVGWV